MVEDGSRKKSYPITHYVLLKKNDFLEAANIDYEKIVDDLEQNDTSAVVREQLVLFMLEMLKAYDEQSKKSEELLWTAERYCEWLIENADNPTEFMELNRLQIIRRKREFDNVEILLLQGLRKEGHELSIRCGANILLGKMESAQDCFDEMADMERESFIEYPICHFGRLNYKKAEN